MFNKINTQLDFMKWRKPAAITSIVLVLLSIIALFYNGLSLGLDFTGGTVIEVQYSEEISLDKVRQQLKGSDYQDAIAQYFGNNSTVLLRLPPLPVEEAKTTAASILALLSNESATDKEAINGVVNSSYQAISLNRVEIIGAQVGSELRDKSGLAMLIALFFMLIYVSLRFKFKFAVGAVIALFHDVMITLGLFSILGMNFDLTVLAGILALIGYSLNDTIVVSDRIREDFTKSRKKTPIELINQSLNATLGRTLATSITTMLVLIPLFLVGGEAIKGLSIAMMTGVMVGTYSSLYVLSNILITMKITREDFMVQQRPQGEADGSVV